VYLEGAAVFAVPRGRHFIFLKEVVL